MYERECKINHKVKDCIYIMQCDFVQAMFKGKEKLKKSSFNFI